jgi:hypothetical protein
VTGVQTCALPILGLLSIKIKEEGLIMIKNKNKEKK